MDAAIKVFAAKGYRSASIATSSRARRGAGTFYLYFGSKLMSSTRSWTGMWSYLRKGSSLSWAGPTTTLRVRQTMRESVLIG